MSSIGFYTMEDLFDALEHAMKPNNCTKEQAEDAILYFMSELTGKSVDALCQMRGK